MLKRTSKDNGHYHMVYVKPDKSTGLSSTAKDGHSHDILINPNTNQLDVYPHIDHTHRLLDLALENKISAKDDVELVAEVVRLRKEAEQYEKDSFEDAEEAEGFYDGDGQWVDLDKESLKADKRACLTFNHVQPKVNVLSGYYRKNRHDFKFFPTEGGDVRVADMITQLVKNVCTQNTFENSEVRVFEDEMITGRGLFNVYLDYDKNMNGEPDIIIEWFPWRDARLGPHENPDASDCEYISKSKMYSLAKAVQLWPDKKSELNAAMNDISGKTIVHKTIPERTYEGKSNITGADLSIADEKDIAKKQIRVTELWRKEYVNADVAVNVLDGFALNISGMKAADISAVKTIPGLSMVKKRVHKMRVTRVAGGVVKLDDDYVDEIEIDGKPDFGIVPAYANKRGPKWWGIVKPAIEPQREINKRLSQAADVTSSMMGKNRFIEDNMFSTPSEENRYKKQGATSGGVYKLIDINKMPTKDEGSEFPVALTEYAMMASSQLSQIMNINPEMMGQQSNARTGAAISEKKDAGLVGNEFLMDNMAFAKRKLIKIVVGLIQKKYTVERIMRMLNNANQVKPFELGKKPFDQFEPQEIQEMLTNLDLTKYDIVVGENAYSPTARTAHLKTFMEIAQTPAGALIPPEVYVNLMDVPEKDSILTQIKENRQQQMQSEQAKNDTEIEKTKIAAQSKMQEKQDKEQQTGQPQFKRVTRIEEGAEGMTRMQEITEGM